MNRIDEVICFAVEKHSGQTRKFSDIPYIFHPLEVASIIATMTEDSDTIAAGILHDTVEDCDVDPREIRDRFGPRVAALVQSETEDKRSDRPPEDTWKARKEESLLMLAHTKDLDVKILWLADKLSNLRSFCLAHQRLGDAMWNTLHQKDPAMQAWYYRTVAEDVSELSDTLAYGEFKMRFNTLFGEGETGWTL